MKINRVSSSLVILLFFTSLVPTCAEEAFTLDNDLLAELLSLPYTTYTMLEEISPLYSPPSWEKGSWKEYWEFNELLDPADVCENGAGIILDSTSSSSTLRFGLERAMDELGWEITQQFWGEAGGAFIFWKPQPKNRVVYAWIWEENEHTKLSLVVFPLYELPRWVEIATSELPSGEETIAPLSPLSPPSSSLTWIVDNSGEKVLVGKVVLYSPLGVFPYYQSGNKMTVARVEIENYELPLLVYSSFELQTLPEGFVLYFSVPKQWIRSVAVLETDIELFRFENGNLSKLPTSVVESDQENVYYMAVVNHSSIFIIGARFSNSNISMWGGVVVMTTILMCWILYRFKFRRRLGGRGCRAHGHPR